MSKVGSKIISREQIEHIEAWDAPFVGEQGEAPPAGTQMMTAQELERLQKQAYDEAFQQGYQAGLNKGEQLMRDKAQTLEAVIGALARPLNAVDEEIERELADLCIAMMKQLLRRELSIDPGQVVAVVKEALNALPMSARKIQIRLHPEDVKLVSGALALSDEDQAWQLVEDPVISRGGCKVVTENSQIHSTVEARVAQVITQVFGGQRESDKDE